MTLWCEFHAYLPKIHTTCCIVVIPKRSEESLMGWPGMYLSRFQGAMVSGIPRRLRLRGMTKERAVVPSNAGRAGNGNPRLGELLSTTPIPPPKIGGGEHYLWCEFRVCWPEIHTTMQNPPPFPAGKGGTEGG